MKQFYKQESKSVGHNKKTGKKLKVIQTKIYHGNIEKWLDSEYNRIF